VAASVGHPPADPVIAIRGVGKHFAQRRGSRNVVLEDVNLEVRAGEFVSLVGASGCGKTTLLRMIAGLAPYQPGTIEVSGRLVRGVPPRIGFVFQDSALLPWRTIRENVALGLNEVRRTMSKTEAREAVDERLELVGLTAYADYLPRQISGGMQQRTGLARALVAEPDVLLMDEPFGALDAFTRMRLQEELATIVARTAATTVFVTHDVDEAVFLSDRIAVMTTNPGTIREVVAVDLERPHQSREALLGNARAAELRDHVLELVIGSRAGGASGATGSLDREEVRG
jgi:ABC-type nitrate/sulfonate/bicarbonate transport system ATPase subunit